MSEYCITCKRSFSSYRYLKCHYKYQSGKVCRDALKKAEALSPILPCKRQKLSLDVPDKVTQELFADVLKNAYADQVILSHGALGEVTENSHVMEEEYSEDEAMNPVFADDNSVEEADDSDIEEAFGTDDEIEPEPITELLTSFKEYTEDCRKNRYTLTPDIEAGVSLMRILTAKRVPLNVYDAIFKWHTENLKATHFVPRKKLMTKLSKRYNMERCRPYVKKLELPFSKSRIDLVCHDMGSQIQSLLTDPRISDDDYLFFDDNPFAPPPDEFRVLGDINTGLCYRKTYNEMIKDPSKEVLLPIIFYMDSAITAKDDQLPIESLQFTLGIFNANTRDKAHAWRNIGYVKKHLVEETQAKDFLKESDHMDAQNYLSDTEPDTEDSESEASSTGNSSEYYETNAQDLHAMLDAMLESFRKLQDSAGIDWKLRHKGKTYAVRFIPFVMFVKGDSQEHDKHCGSYTSRTEKIQQLCRYCCCKNADTDDAHRRDALKHPGMIQKLVDRGDATGLQALSQQMIYNCWYNIKFGLHNKLGIHGATPMEILHWFQLGKYKYLRQMFFGQTGKDSALANKFNALCKMMGILFKRQSDRDLPRMEFSRGVKEGKMTAQEMTGVILVLLATIVSTDGTNCLLTECKGGQKKFFSKVEFLQDWVLLIETMLQWEAWLQQPEISVYDIRRSKTKVREIMEMEKTIGRREKGMGFKTFNFHAALHVGDDMLNFGVPNNVNTRSNEQHHKVSKTAAKRTQRRVRTFDQQCATQLHHIATIDMAAEECYNDRPVWEYLTREYETVLVPPVPAEEEQQHKLTGARSVFSYSPERDEYIYTVNSRMEGKHLFKYPVDVLDKLEEMQKALKNVTDELCIYTEHVRHGQMFRASPRFLGKAWFDWVMINWGNGPYLPAQIHCFVDLRDIPSNRDYKPGIYAIIESAEPIKEEEVRIQSELFRPYAKETETDEEGNAMRKFYVVDVESFVSPVCVVPDVGHANPGAVLCLLPRSEWAGAFKTWLSTEHSREFTEDN